MKRGLSVSHAVKEFYDAVNQSLPGSSKMHHILLYYAPPDYPSCYLYDLE
jgi:hypothetical protein